MNEKVVKGKRFFKFEISNDALFKVQLRNVLDLDLKLRLSDVANSHFINVNINTNSSESQNGVPTLNSTSAVLQFDLP